MSSFAPKDFGQANPPWNGGAATITNPHFTYREYDIKNGENAGQHRKIAVAKITFLDEDGQDRQGQYDIGNAEYCVIRESAADDAEAVDVGYSYSGKTQGSEFKLRPDSDFARFTASLVAAGYPENKLEDGDIRTLEGLEVVVFNHPKKDGDKFPLRLIKSVKLKAGAATRAASSGPSEAVRDTALNLTMETLNEAGTGTPVPRSTIVKKAMVLKDKQLKADVVDYLSKAAFYTSSDAWLYDADDKTLTLL